MKHYDTIIIGGGASGLAAAVMTKTEQNTVLIIEHNDRVGKKILSTGNGKCNFTNAFCRTEAVPGKKGAVRFVKNPERIRPFVSSADDGFAEEVIRRYDAEAAFRFFLSLGMLPLNRNGYYYPRCEQASAVLDLLRNRAAELGVELLCGYQPMKVFRIRKNSTGGKQAADQAAAKSGRRFQIDDLYTCRNLIVAAGGQNASKTGSDGSGYEIAKGFGHHVIRPLPALCALKCSDPFFKELQGVRTDAQLSLYLDQPGDKELLMRVNGNLQLNSYGISGIPVFQMSLLASRLLAEGKKLLVRINFLPEYSGEELAAFFASKQGDKFTGVLNKKLANVVLKESRKAHPDETEDTYNYVYTHMIQGFKVHPVSTVSFEEAQTTLGGVDTNEIDPETMESRIVPGLYFTGEIVDVSGICGGYNLQWAWATAHAAAAACQLPNS